MKHFLLAALLPLTAAAEGVPVQVQYARTGTEKVEKLLSQGKAEIANGNPCVLKMKRELEELADSPEITRTVTVLRNSVTSDPEPRPVFVLHFMNNELQLRLEVQSGEVPDDYRTRPLLPRRAIYSKAIPVANEKGTWQKRIVDGACTVSRANFEALIAKVREPERLLACKERKLDLLPAATRVSAYLHEYIPDDWLKDARAKLIRERGQIPDVLREDQFKYRSGNKSFKSCLKGMILLEDEARATIQVLRRVSVDRSGTDLPEDDLARLESALSRKLPD